MTAWVGLVVALASASVAGLVVVGFAFGRRASTSNEWLGRAALGSVVGLGLSSMFAFAWLFLAGALGALYPVADAMACLALAGGMLTRRRTRDGLRIERLDAVQIALTGALLLAIALATWRFVAASGAMPHGEWDAWEVWNFRARHILRAGNAWRDAFGVGLKSTEYPLLLPLSIARLWTYGGESTLAPAVVAGVFTMGSALIVAGLVSGISGGVAGTTSGMLLLGTAGFQWWGAQQYGDVPLATFLAAAVGVMVLARSSDAPRTLLALCGLLLGLAGWTKTDGVVAAGVVAMVLLVAEWRRGGRAAAFGAIRPVALGALLPALAWCVQHVVLARGLAPVLTQGQSALGTKFLDPGRWSTVLGWFVDKAPGRDIWLPILVIGIALLVGLQPRRLVRSVALWCAGLMYLVDVLVFVSTPLDLGFHLLTAGDRLMLQPWPLFILAVFASVGSPRLAEKPLAAETGEKKAGGRHGTRQPKRRR